MRSKVQASFATEFNLKLELRPDFILDSRKIAQLRAIDEKAAIGAAAAVVGVSYKRIWTVMRELNAAFTDPLVVSERGGSGGGRASLTPLGRRVLDLYNRMETKAAKSISGSLLDLRHLLGPVKGAAKSPKRPLPRGG